MDDLIKKADLVITEIQDSLPVHQLVYRNIYYWPILKWHISTLILNDSWYSTTVDKPRYSIKKIGLFFSGILADIKTILLDFKSSKFRYSKADIFYSTHSTCRTNLDGKYFDIFFSHLVEIANKRDIKMVGEEFSAKGEIRIPRYETTKMFNTRIVFISLISVFANKLKLVNLNQDNLLNDIDNLLKKYNVSKINRDQIRKGLLSVYLSSEHYKRILETVQPKAVLVVSWYGSNGYALMNAANQLGITTFDIQHGVQGPFHSAYSALPMHSIEYWNLLPKFFCTWTANESNYINQWGKGKHKAIVIGNIWHDYYFRNKIIFNKNNYAKALREFAKDYDKLVLFTLQPYGNNDDFLGLIKKCTQSSKLKKYCFLVRLHPSMFGEEEKYNSLLCSENTEIINTSRCPLTVLLDMCDLHITIDSSVVIEAAQFGVQSLLCGTNSIYYQDLIDKNIALCINDSTDLIDQILKCQNKYKKEYSKIDTERVFNELIDDIYLSITKD